VLTSAAPVLGPLGDVTELLGLIYSGSPTGIGYLSSNQFLGSMIATPLVALSKDPGDGAGSGTYGVGGAVGPGAPFAIAPFAANHSRNQTIAQVMTPQQQALLGCGAFYGTNCDSAVNLTASGTGFGGVDLLNAEASALLQSWAGIDGTATNGFRADMGPQPGTVGFNGGPVCTRVMPDGSQVILPGCRGAAQVAEGYTLSQDGANTGPTGGAVVDANGVVSPVKSVGYPAGVGAAPPIGNLRLGGKVLYKQGHPFTGAAWTSEMAAFSWNLQMLLVGLSDATTTSELDGYQPIPGRDPTLSFDFTSAAAAYRVGGCSFVQPQYCSNIRAIYNVVGATRNTVNAGGNGRFGRRDFVWAGGGDVVLNYQRRNVLGFSSDFAEDYSKSNWSVEFTWVNRQPYENASRMDGISKPGTYNLTLSVDRPTFINFLNQSRTFFFNSQMFFQYVPGYKNSFSSNGPWNFLFTFTAQTGYFQDRLLPSMTWVYDVQSNSGAVIPEIQYRITESFSATIGMALFWGRYQAKEYPLSPLSVDNQVGRGAYTSWVENGLAVVRQRDELYFNLRYTF
jgi:hypothetical protein